MSIEFSAYLEEIILGVTVTSFIALAGFFWKVNMRLQVIEISSKNTCDQISSQESNSREHIKIISEHEKRISVIEEKISNIDNGHKTFIETIEKKFDSFEEKLDNLMMNK